jgi:hypothetical protein
LALGAGVAAGVAAAAKAAKDLGGSMLGKAAQEQAPPKNLDVAQWLVLLTQARGF